MKVQIIYKASLVFFCCHVMMVCRHNEKLFAFDHSEMENKCYGDLTNTKHKHYDKCKLSNCTDYATFYTDKTFEELKKWEQGYFKKTYNILTNNCIHLVQDVLKGFFRFEISQVPSAWIFFYMIPIYVPKNPLVLNSSSFLKGVNRYIEQDELFLLDDKNISSEVRSAIKRVLSYHKQGMNGEKITKEGALRDFDILHKHFPNDSLVHFRKGNFYERGLNDKESAFKSYCLAYKHIANRQLRFAMTQHKLPTKRNIIRSIVSLVCPDKVKDFVLRDQVAKLLDRQDDVSIADIQNISQARQSVGLSQ